MNLKIIKSLVGAGFLGFLLITGGCMMAPNHSTYTAASSHNNGSAQPVSELSPKSESTNSHSHGGHHAMPNDSHWGWLAGSGMVLMMILVAL